ncbi:MAG: Na+/H+ antiporter NhaC family protein [Bacteroidota bacterium]
MENNHTLENKELSISEALIPVLFLISMLAYNIFVEDGGWFGDYSNHYILLATAFIATIVGLVNRVSLATIFQEIGANLKSVLVPIVILLLVGALAGTWMISGVVPAMVFYGLKILNPTVFLAAAVVICAIISLATGSSWTTTATVGIALVGIAGSMDISAGMAAGAIISGAYFGDKMSPLSDTTNLAPAMAGGELFSHIRYMMYTTFPSITITLIVFIIIGLNQSGTAIVDDNSAINQLLLDKFNISPWLFLVPIIVIGVILLRVKPIIALSIGALLGGVFAILFQPQVLAEMAGTETLAIGGQLQQVINALLFENQLVLPEFIKQLDISSTELESLPNLIGGKGMQGMLWTVYLIIAAMIFGGAMDGIGALARITRTLLDAAKSVFGLFASTVASCLALNLTASDQYLALVVPGKMFKNAYEDRGLAPENLSRTLEDSGTVTSVLIPWNTCGAYQSSTLDVSVGEYFIYAIFNWISPFTTLLFAALGLKIKQLTQR